MSDHFSSYSDDFLSNGIYELYTTQYDDDILLWNGEDSKLKISDDSKYHIDNVDTCDYTDYEVVRNDGQIIDGAEETSNQLWSIPLENNLTKIGADWELNIENLLFDNCDECPMTNKQLPDKTVFCSESCNLFLKESAEGLLSNLNAFDHEKSKNLASDATHTDQDKLFVCTFNDCKKVYAKSAHLKAHLRRHIGLKPYVCSWPNCTWKFSRSDELSRHRRSHSGVKPYQCSYCTKCFSRSDHLTKHRKVHERKMAAIKIKSVWTNLPHYPRQGRKPKSQL